MIVPTADGGYHQPTHDLPEVRPFAAAPTFPGQPAPSTASPCPSPTPPTLPAPCRPTIPALQPPGRRGPIDAAIAVSRDRASRPSAGPSRPRPRPAGCPRRAQCPRPAGPRALELADVQAPAQRGQGRGRPDQADPPPRGDGQLDIHAGRNPNEARLRYQRHQPPLLPQRHLGQQGQPRPGHRLRHRRRPGRGRLGQGLLRLCARWRTGG